MTKNKDQHYVSAFYLYHFTNYDQRLASTGRPHRETNIYHFDINRKCVRERPIKNVAIESYLLSHQKEDGSYDHSLDIEVQAVETKASKAIEELNDILKHSLKKKPGSVEITNSIIDDLMELLFWQIKRHPEIIHELKNDCEQYLFEHNWSTQDAKQMALKVIKGGMGSGQAN